MPQLSGHDDLTSGLDRPARDPQSGPFDALLHAVQSYDPAAVAAALAPDVRLSVPPLRIHVNGAADVAATILEVTYAFDYLRYTMRSRYLAPGQVTDEAELSGVHARDLLGAPPTGRASTVVLRVIAAQRDGRVSDLSIWPDVAAVRGLCDELARHIDERHAGSAGAMVTALRATIPAVSSKVVHGQARQLPADLPAGTVPTVVLPPAQRPSSRTQGLKVPLTRQSRRLRAVLAGTVMAAVSVAIIVWVANGAMQAPRGGAALVLPYPPDSPTAAPLPGRSAGPAGSSPSVAAGSTVNGESLGVPGASRSASANPSPTPAPPPPVKIVHDQVEFSDDLLFDFGKATLAPRAQAELGLLVEKVIDEKRFGKIAVHGYTDNQGDDAYNMLLSKRRATAVAQWLKDELASRGHPEITITSQGHGKANPRQPNDSPQHQAENRRVTVKVSPPGV